MELTDQGTARDLGLILWDDSRRADRTPAMGASGRQGCLQDFIDHRGVGGQAVAVAAMGFAGFPAGLLGL